VERDGTLDRRADRLAEDDECPGAARRQGLGDAMGEVVQGGRADPEQREDPEGGDDRTGKNARNQW